MRVRLVGRSALAGGVPRVPAGDRALRGAPPRGRRPLALAPTPLPRRPRAGAGVPPQLPPRRRGHGFVPVRGRPGPPHHRAPGARRRGRPRRRWGQRRARRAAPGAVPPAAGAARLRRVVLHASGPRRRLLLRIPVPPRLCRAAVLLLRGSLLFLPAGGPARALMGAAAVRTACLLVARGAGGRGLGQLRLQLLGRSQGCCLCCLGCCQSLLFHRIQGFLVGKLLRAQRTGSRQFGSGSGSSAGRDDCRTEMRKRSDSKGCTERGRVLAGVRGIWACCCLGGGGPGRKASIC
mmetsp:Transcript_43274/g.102683  ORF Transcript_43274/g.102683 Transcript_43274/m.102683 type:complete len:292 (-) Transcript_43274:935-1810(-)